VRFRLAILLHLFFLAFQFVAQINRRQVCREPERKTELSGKARFLPSRVANGKTVASGDLAIGETAIFYRVVLSHCRKIRHHTLHSTLRTCNNRLKPVAW